MHLGGEEGTRTLNLLLAKQLRYQLRHNPINNLENLIKRTLPVFILYSYNATHYSATVTISLSPRAVALKLLTAVPKNPSTKGNLFTPNFHPPFR